MVSKNNKKALVNRLENKKLHYTIKKLKVGVGSVVIGSSLIFGSQVVLANENLDSSPTQPDHVESSPSVASETVIEAVGEQVHPSEEPVQASEGPEALVTETSADVPIEEEISTEEKFDDASLNETPQISGENNHSSHSRVTRQAPEISGGGGHPRTL